MAIVLDPSTHKRRTRLRWAALLGLLLMILAFSGAWWLLRPTEPPLTAAEQPFVGYWEPPAPVRVGSRTDETVGFEFRTDRKVIYHRRDPKTGARSTEDTGVRWRAEDDTFFYCARARKWPLGIVSEPVVLEMHVTWDGPDHCRMSLVHHGKGGTPTDDLTRRPAPGGP
jgi:hypothetical protein